MRGRGHPGVDRVEVGVGVEDADREQAEPGASARPRPRRGRRWPGGAVTVIACSSGRGVRGRSQSVTTSTGRRPSTCPAGRRVRARRVSGRPERHAPPAAVAVAEVPHPARDRPAPRPVAHAGALAVQRTQSVSPDSGTSPRAGSAAPGTVGTWRQQAVRRPPARAASAASSSASRATAAPSIARAGAQEPGSASATAPGRPATGRTGHRSRAARAARRAPDGR